MRRGLWTLVLLYAACTKPNPDYCDADTPCADGKYCDADGAVEGTKNACIDVSCDPGAFGLCDGDSALSCLASGDGYAPTACSFGCGAAGCNACAASTDSCDGAELEQCDANGQSASSEACLAGCVADDAPHCARISPRFAPDICDTPATDAILDVSSSGSLDTGLDQNCNGGVVAQAGGPELCVMHFGAITIETGTTLKITGTRAVALVADDELVVAGTLDVSADQGTNGPGGGFVKSGDSRTNSPTIRGGGGAGFSTSGAAGGSTTTNGGGGAGGAAQPNPIALAVLMGGPQSGETQGLPGGGGGGGATLISCRGTTRISGTIDAGGGGGLPCIDFLGNPIPGAGGGAGGYVVLQGALVEVTGRVFANGGGGGGGCLAADGFAGGDGPLSDSEGGYGGTGVDGGGTGGNGGFGPVQPPTVGAHPTNANARPGGGGGSVGFLQTYTPEGVTPTLTPMHVSPPFEPNGTVTTR
ncbi:MAG TPA: hypothetical protein VGM88_03130 [Kofleriaceae bacterium]|jgi:hypothetical protein